MGRDFCSFGSKRGIVNENNIYSKEEITNEVEKYVRQRVHYIVLCSTQFFDISVLLDIVVHIRSCVKGSYELILNIGEFDLVTADKMYEAGFNGIYHAIRLREGVDTRFNVEDRRKTLAEVRDSKLKLIHLFEPLGEEHTPEEIAERFLESVSYGVSISGVMARIPVKGTSLGDTKRISDNKIAKNVAIIRLSGGDVVKDICVHPASTLAIYAGANVTVIEKGAVLRDINLSCDEWNDFKCLEAAQLFVDRGYAICKILFIILLMISKPICFFMIIFSFYEA